MGERLKLNEISGNVVSFDTNLERKLESLKINIEPVQEGSGDPSPDNIRPISGWTGANISHGWDVFKQNAMLYKSGAYISPGATTGNTPYYQTNANYNVFALDVMPNTVYRVDNIKANDPCTCLIDTNNIITYVTKNNGGTTGTSFTIQAGPNDAKMLISVAVSGTYKCDDVLQIYEINTLPITFPSAAGTVYGGTLDVTTGALTVTHGTLTIASSNTSIRTSSSGYYPYYMRTNLTGLAQVGSSTIKCDSLTLKSSAQITAGATGFYRVADGQSIIYWVTPDCATEEGANSLRDAGYNFVYKLNTPTIYQLTPIEVLTLLGANTIYANCGEIEAKWCDEELVQSTKTRDLTLENCKEGPVNSFVVTCTNYYKSGTPSPTNETFLYEINDIGFAIGSFENEVPLIPDNYTPVTASGATLNYLGDGVYFLEGMTTQIQSYDVPLKPFTLDVNKKYMRSWEVLSIEQKGALFGIPLFDSQGNRIGVIYPNLQMGQKSISLVNATTSTDSNNPHIRFVVEAGYKNVKFKYKIFEVDSNKVYSPDISAIPQPFYHFSYDAMTGVLTLPRKTKTLTADDLIEVGTSDSGVQYAITTDILDIKPNSEVTGNRHYWENPGNNNTMKSENKHIIIYDNRFTDLATAKELIEGTIVYYYLNTPETYQLESYPVTLQKGTNVFFGNFNYSKLSVKYREEIKDSILSLRRRSFAWDYKNYIASHPAVLQKLCSTGKASNYFKIGDEIIIPWTDNSGDTPIEYQYPFIIVDITDVYDENNILHQNGVWLMAKYAEPYSIQFDAPEKIEVNLTEEPSALEGWYYWGLNNDTYTLLELSIGDTIPTSYDKIYKSAFNNQNILKIGYDRWKDSAYRQWLNSDARKNENWWISKHMGDTPPSEEEINKPGWMNGFNDEWKKIFKPIKIQTATNTVTDNGIIDITYDKFFLPSLEQVYGIPEIKDVEGPYWPYFKNQTGLSSPSNDYNVKRRLSLISDINGTSVNRRLRSVSRNTTSFVYGLISLGFIGSSYSNLKYYSQPTCVIY